MIKTSSKHASALAGLATLLFASCGGRVLESDGVGGANSQVAGQADDGGTRSAVAGAPPAAKAGAGASTDEPVATAPGLCRLRQCDCALATQRACNGHPEDGIGTCRAGTQECVLFAGVQTAFGDCHGDVGPMTEGCGPQMPDSNCNGLVGDGDYQLQPGCARPFNRGNGNLVNLFAAPHPGTIAVHLCTTRCKSFSYLAPSCDGNSILSDEIQGYAAATPLPNYVLVSIPASSCVQSAAYASAAYDVQAPAFTFYALP